MKVLVTGAAGFIGSHVAHALIDRGIEVVGIDTLNAYYDPVLKKARLERLTVSPKFSFQQADVSDRDQMNGLMADNPDIRIVVHLAAQAGVRYSLVDPYSYVNTNVMGQVVLLEACRKLPSLEHFIYASSSSVYGQNTSLPFKESDRVDAPGSLYAVTKRAGELTATAYAHLHGIPQTGLRFFTVYGPWGRPDMAYYGFAKAICAGEPVTLYEGSGLSRDFTYIDDITSGVLAVMDHPAKAGEARLFNLGGDHPEKVTRLIGLLEETLGRKAQIEFRPRPAADMESTWASLEAVQKLSGWKPETNLETGIGIFSAWFRNFQGF
ncbi:SDR family NAD(P)-dependent oxidoreductase [Gluconobacter wancherniae]|uniref:NAD-dependent epimerase n=1 Tax=Gluconobacter wancherniae NBRC 103581 TaxID=656744 RepID=A0A511B3Y4_9PROT|nr:SDR family NAD(P)-dependent oxidoreductase [Gluconobacter wancherniae]MBF0854507.1 SDR family NAD(P)-dependent oxidoreductase [Gluconobacter wancherniae]GBD57768.1 NAD-dependent epimerase [Gluconobacter wancherniae NBRC 103581]GBR62475.1 UDP-N-acetylglucosamine 4-epimerase [Gluconobacter wancherniae NBRC 103581]GEK94373.1 NAD-dependent epimerase [Gluconobacter wancherniae NBRC 103581]